MDHSFTKRVCPAREILQSLTQKLPLY